MADEKETPPKAAQPSPPDDDAAASAGRAEAAQNLPAAKAAGDKPPSDAPVEPLKGEVSRVSDPGAGASAAKPAAAARPPAPAHAQAAAPPSGPSDPPPPADARIPPFIGGLQAALPGAVEHLSFWVGDWTIIVGADRLLEVARHLRDAPDARFDYLSDVTASDWPPRPKRFDVVYCLFSTARRERVRVKVRAGDGDPVPSVTSIWPAANWLEREVYDLFGVNFTGHPDRRRILMPDEWQGHPQRKDYPLEGPGELLMENPLDWLRLRTAHDTADIE